MMHLTGLVDCNNFFVSCERLFRPDLERRPVVVLSSNDGCVVARSQEIKDKGIPMGAPYFQVKDILSHMEAAVFSSNFTLYRDISARVFGVVRRELGQFEQYSIDEGFFSIPTDGALNKAREVRAIVAKEVGIPVSVGLGLSRTQAKYANQLAKKTDGVFCLESEVWAHKQQAVSLSEIWGVGRARARRFAGYGLNTVSEYLALSRAQARQLFGIEGERLWAELRGEVGEFVPAPPALKKTLMSTRSFASPVAKKGVLRAALIQHLHGLVKELASMQAVATSVRVMAYPSRFGDYLLQGMSAEFHLPVPSRDIFTLSRYVDDALDGHFRQSMPYKKAGIVVSVLSEQALSGQLFPVDDTTHSQVLTDILLKINEEHGRDLLQLGIARTQSSQWATRTDRLSPSYTTNWRALRIVRA